MSDIMQPGAVIREKLHSNERTYGIHVKHLSGSAYAEAVRKTGLDFVFLDTEHAPTDRGEIAWMCRYYASHGISPIVRIAYPDPNLASMAMDGGAHGIVAPYVETVDEVKKLVGAVKYRPLKGKLLREALDGDRKLNPKTDKYLQEHNRNHYLIIGVESVEAYRNLDALLAVEGVDGVFIGPHDMTVSMEIPEEYTHEAYLKTVLDIIRRSRAAGLGVGLHCKPDHVSSSQFSKFLEAGMNWILYYGDVYFMADAVKNGINELKTIAGDR